MTVLECRAQRVGGRLVILIAIVLIGAFAAPAEAQRKKRDRKKKPPVEEPAPTVPEEPEAPDEAPPPEEPADDTAWSRGVSPEQRRTAERLLQEGNALFLDGKQREALAAYQEAIASWDHPAIRFNIVRALIHLDRPVEAFENLEQALRFGSDPLEEQVYAEAENYRRLLLGQIAELEVTCAQDGVKIAVDGQDFLQCPGARTARMLPGNHQIIGKRPGFLTSTRDVVLLPGAKNPQEIKLVSLADATVTERRWTAWKPWAIAGTGAIVGGVGALLQLKAQSDFDQYGEEITMLCSEMPCAEDDLPASTRDLASRARLENQLAIGSMIAGGAIVVTGLTLVILNRPRSVIPEEMGPPGGPQVVPAIGPGAVSLSVIQRF